MPLTYRATVVFDEDSNENAIQAFVEEIILSSSSRGKLEVYEPVTDAWIDITPEEGA